MDVVARCASCGDRIGMQYARMCWCSCGAVCVHGQDAFDESP